MFIETHSITIKKPAASDYPNSMPALQKFTMVSYTEKSPPSPTNVSRHSSRLAVLLFPPVNAHRNPNAVARTLTNPTRSSHLILILMPHLETARDRNTLLDPIQALDVLQWPSTHADLFE